VSIEGHKVYGAKFRLDSRPQIGPTTGIEPAVARRIMHTAVPGNDIYNLQPMLTAQQVAALLAVSLRRFEQMVASGLAPPHVRVGRLRRWHQADVKAWMEGLAG